MTTKEKRQVGRPINEETLRDCQRIVNFVKDYHEINDIAPTLKEIAVGIGRKATDVGNIHPYVQLLIREGFLVNAGRNQGRSLAVPKKLPRKYFYKLE